MAELTCTKGMLRIDMFGGVYISQNDKWKHLPRSVSDNTEHEALMKEWEAFVEAVDTNSSPQVSGGYGKHIIEICLAARESSLKSQEIWL